MDKVDVEFYGDGEMSRVERLMRVYMRLDDHNKRRVKRLEDHEGCLTAQVDAACMEVFSSLSDAWGKEGENMMVIKWNDRIVCECG